jgi:hypothetical protein
MLSKLMNPNRTRHAFRAILFVFLVYTLSACNADTPTGPTVNIGPAGSTGPVVEIPGVVNNTNFVARESFSFQVNVPRNRLRLDAVNGDITITGNHGAGGMTVAGERRVESESQADADEKLRQLEVQVLEMADEVLVETSQPDNTGGRNYVVDYIVTVPTNTEAFVENINGNVSVMDITGSTTVHLVNGQIDGRLTLPPDGFIDLMATNGTIDLAIPRNTSASFSATLSNGSIEIENLALQGETRTPNSLQGILGDGRGRIELLTVNGNIRISGF